MAKQASTYFVGTIQNVIYYYDSLRDLYLVRSKPARVKQTKATKASASIFGKAVQVAARLRQQLKAIIPNNNKNMQNRFQGFVQRLLIEHMVNTTPRNTTSAADDNFKFNEKASLPMVFKKSVAIDFNDPTQVRISVPAFNSATDISAPATTCMIQFSIAIGTTELEKTVAVSTNIHQWNVPYTNELQPEKEFVLPVSIPLNSISVVTFSLKYFSGTGGNLHLINNQRYLPAEIIGVKVS